MNWIANINNFICKKVYSLHLKLWIIEGISKQKRHQPNSADYFGNISAFWDVTHSSAKDLSMSADLWGGVNYEEDHTHILLYHLWWFIVHGVWHNHLITSACNILFICPPTPCPYITWHASFPLRYSLIESLEPSCLWKNWYKMCLIKPQNI